MKIKEEVMDITKVPWRVETKPSRRPFGGLFGEIWTDKYGYTEDHFCRNGKLKKNAVPVQLRIAITKSEVVARYICDTHNLFLAENKADFIKAEIEKQMEQRFGIAPKPVSQRNL